MMLDQGHALAIGSETLQKQLAMREYEITAFEKRPIAVNFRVVAIKIDWSEDQLDSLVT
jgi:hypothetical protein